MHRNRDVFWGGKNRWCKTIENFVQEEWYKFIKFLWFIVCFHSICYNIRYLWGCNVFGPQKADLDHSGFLSNSALMGACFKGYPSLAELLLNAQKRGQDLVNYNKRQMRCFTLLVVQGKMCGNFVGNIKSIRIKDIF
jgi:hypothetical protein